MTTESKPLDLALSDMEIVKAIKAKYPAHAPPTDEWRAVGDAATAKAALFFKGTNCWCGMGPAAPFNVHTLRCNMVRTFVEAAGIQKPEAT